jgi:hypothetical protein
MPDISNKMVRCEVGDVNRSNSLVNVSPSCLEMEVLSKEEPIPLKSCHPSINNKGQELNLQLGCYRL